MEDKPYHDRKYSCAWCYSSKTFIIVDPPKKGFLRHDREDAYYNNKQPLDPRHDREEAYYNNKQPLDPRHDREDRYYKDPIDDRDRIPQPIFSNHFIIDCYDCSRYSEVRIIKCNYCPKVKVNIKRTLNFIDLENTFYIPKIDYFCIECEHNYIPPKHHYFKQPCNHNYVKYSGEIFSCGPVFTLKCTYCGDSKTTSPNGTEPYNDNYPNGDGY